MTADRLARAFGYPYAIPARSFVLRDGVAHPLDAKDAETHRAGRTPVLAVGSNQSPEQLARKFQGTGWTPVPSERCVVEDFDTVYSAHVTAYGSIAAALHQSPGTQVTLFVNWLDDAQLRRMHETELGNENYSYARLDDIRLVTDFGHRLDSVHFYRSNVGAYAPEGVPVALAEVAAENRRWQAMSQRDIHGRIHADHGVEVDLEAFVLAAIEDPAERQRRKRRMRARAHAFDHPRIDIIES